MTSQAFDGSLVTSEHSDKPKFMATLAASTGPLAVAYSATIAVGSAYDVDTAVGVQLDRIGEWAGRSRYIATPLTNVYFTWDADAVTGWDAGSWLGPYDSETGLTALPDDAYRILLKAKIAANRWDGSIPGAYAVWEQAFASVGSTIAIQDNQDMTMDLVLMGPTPSTITRALILGGYIPLKPEGVRISKYYISYDANPVFAWDADQGSMRGWDAGNWAYENRN